MIMMALRSEDSNSRSTFVMRAYNVMYDSAVQAVRLVWDIGQELVARL
jgi:hypothetical protein